MKKMKKVSPGRGRRRGVGPSRKSAQAGHELSLPPSGRLVFPAWDGPVVTKDVVAKYQEFAAAGMTHNMTAFRDRKEARIGLDAARKAGVGILTRYWPHSPTVSPADMARHFKDHPALAGYILQDEPTISEFPALLARTKEVLAIDPDPNKAVCVNLLPVYAGNEMIELKPYQKYEDYVFKFLSEVPVNVLSYDHYPLKRFAPVASWYENLLVGQRAANSAGIPLWSFICCCGMDLFPDPTMATLRVQAYNNLAMGAVGIEHFLYRACGGRVAPYDRGGNRTYVYDLVKQLNRELQSQAGVFVGSKTWYNPRWSGPNTPAGYKPFEPEGIIRSLATGGKCALINLLRKDKHRFLVIVNQDFLQPMPLSVRWDPQTRLGRVGRDGSVAMLPRPNLDTVVEPGDAAILMWQDQGE
jgi:hypothetical protein